jgi:hypothetical protein
MNLSRKKTKVTTTPTTANSMMMLEARLLSLEMRVAAGILIFLLPDMSRVHSLLDACG